ncbi:acyl-ACP thioesterase [Clostridia bacterium]|nr:acyl-ACP thioesterase [Clostridia bacterium]
MNKTSYVSKVMFSDCDQKGRYKLSSALKVASEIAGFDYTVKGYSHEFLLSKDMLFLVSKVSLKIFTFLQAYQNYKIRTWENGKKGVLFVRGFEILDENGELMIQGISGWALINPRSGKVYKPIEFPYPQEQLNETFECKPLGKIQHSELTQLGERTVRYSDLDQNNHVNNAVYSDIAVDVLPNKYYDETLDNFRVTYHTAAILGDTITLFGAETEDGYVVVGYINEKACFETEFTFVD